MMDFFSRVDISADYPKITHSGPVFLLGSCFSASIAERMERELFDVTCNPLGTLYNPLSILGCLEALASRKQLAESELIANGGLYHSFMCHTSLSRTTPQETLESINASISRGAYKLINATHIFITLGTAWVYRLRSTGSVVANCHKLPAEMFVREMLDIHQCSETLDKCIKTIRRVNPDASVCFTVSPIRHLSDGAHANTLSKSTLHLAVQSLIATHSGVHYFPAFEIICDELRDYRFYAADMAHPSEVAAEYMYERFASVFYSENTRKVAKECTRVYRTLHHRPISSNTGAIDALRKSAADTAVRIMNQYPETKPTLCKLLSIHNISV